MYKFIDLFAGCGGLSEGFYKEKFSALAHVEINATACKTLVTRMKYYGYKNAEDSVLEIDITKLDIIAKLDTIVKSEEVDVIIGGPPCQAYSTLGRAKDENAMQGDPRNFLFESYVKILNYYMPKFFVFENVIGILTAKINGQYIINDITKSLGENYNLKINPKDMVLNSADYGVPQIRKRVIIIGVRKDLDIDVEDVYAGISKTHVDSQKQQCEGDLLKPYVTVREAIEELPSILPGCGEAIVSFKSKRDNHFLKRIALKDENILRDHVARNHNSKDIERYKVMSKYEWTFQDLLEKREDLRHEKQRVFGNSYTVQVWDRPAKTIIAHLYKDGNQFIHPDYKQGRTFTVREAARLQSFPDNFVFEGPRTEQFKQIGNAVPPLLAEAIAKCIKKNLDYLCDEVEIDDV
ncbi:MAG: DNA cytosine methyltransferase [Eubacteriales bacterium]